MSSLKAPYGVSKSPDVRARKGGKLVSSSQPRLEEVFSPCARNQAKTHRSGKPYASHKNLPLYHQPSAFETQADIIPIPNQRVRV